jgi:type IV fimbrial biogenesis protein FimT
MSADMSARLYRKPQAQSCVGQLGVSMVEVLVVVAIIGTVMFVVIPEISTWMRNLAVRNVAESVKGGLERARLEALRRNAAISFWLVADTNTSGLTDACTLSNESGSWVVSGQNPEGLCGTAASPDDGAVVIEKWAASEGGSAVVVAATDGNNLGADRVTFTSLGQLSTLTPSAAQIDIKHASGDARNLRILINAGGSVRLCDPNVAADDPRRCG